MEVTCRCGWTTRGTKAQVVANVQAHGRTAHQTDLTPAEVRRPHARRGARDLARRPRQRGRS